MEQERVKKGDESWQKWKDAGFEQKNGSYDDAGCVGTKVKT